jgi:hypothetical protein
MPWSKLLARIRDARWLGQNLRPLTLDLAEQVRSSLSFRVLAMPRAEARGYIRAKATPIVRRALGSVTAAHPALTSELVTRVAGELTDRVARQVLDDVIRGKVLIHGVRRAA